MNKEKIAKWSLTIGVLLLIIGVVGLSFGSTSPELIEKKKNFLKYMLAAGILLMGVAIFSSDVSAAVNTQKAE